MTKNKIVLKESDLRKLISETVKEVALKGKSGKNYSLHGNNGSDWATMSQVRGHKHDGSHYGKSWHAWNKDEQNYLDLTDADDNSWNERSNDAKDIADNIDEAKANKTAKNKIKLTEPQLHSIIKESVKRVLKETSIYTDDPHHYDEYSDESPRGEYPSGKQGDIDYSWDEYDSQYGNTPGQRYNRQGITNQDAENRRLNQGWTPRELSQRDHAMNKWIGGKGDTDRIGDRWDALHDM